MIACMDCGRIMRVRDIGVQIHETTETGEPYKLWSADIIECPSCLSAVVVIAQTQKPILEHWENGFTKRAKGVQTIK